MTDKIEMAYVSASLAENGIPDMHTWKIMYRGRELMHVEVDVPRIRDDPVFGLTWTTTVSTKRGLDAIRQSYQRFKEAYREGRNLEGIRNAGSFVIGDATFEISYTKRDFFPLLVSASLSDSDHSESETLSRTVAMNLEDFLNPNSLRTKSPAEQNPLLWIRVDTEYMSYYFQGEQKEGKRDCGIIEDHKSVGEIVKFYKDTVRSAPSKNHLDELQRVLEQLLKDYPEYIKR